MEWLNGRLGGSKGLFSVFSGVNRAPAAGRGRCMVVFGGLKSAPSIGFALCGVNRAKSRLVMSGTTEKYR